MRKSSLKWLSLWATPLIMLLVTFVTFGVFSFQQGYYWDDWSFAWTRIHLGREGMLQIFSVTRPMRGGIEALLTSLLGVNPFVWQIYTMLVRWIATVSFWCFLRTMWPNRIWQATSAALLMLVYPGFSQQPLAMTYHYYWTFTALFFLSLTWMMQAVQKEHFHWLQFSGAVFLSGLVLWSMEYLFGLELLRPVFLWLALRSHVSNLKLRLKKTILYYVPFVLTTSIYLFWRFILYQGSNYTLDMATTHGITTYFSPLLILSKMLETVPTVSLSAWMQVIRQPFLAENLSLALVMVYGVVLVGGAIGLAYFFKVFFPAETDVSGKDSNPWDLLLVALLLLFFAGLPFYLTNLPVRLIFPEDRFTLPFIPGVSLLIAGLLAFIKNNLRRFTLVALLIPLAMTLQIHNTDMYRNEWKSQRFFLWQLTWRAPEIEPGTTFLSDDKAIFPHNDDEAFTFLVNWAYEPKSTSKNLTYEFSWISARLGGQLPGLKPGLPIKMDYAGPTFMGNTDQVLVVRYSPPSCLRILDSLYDADAPLLPRGVDVPYADSNIAYFVLPRPVAQALPLSNPEAVISEDSQPSVPEWLFGKEPEHHWCYYFQKADLARQQGNWVKVASLGDEAFNAPYYPNDPAEYLPFIEAYGRLGRLDEARALTEKAVDLNPALQPMLYTAWQRIESSGSNDIDTIQGVQKLLKYCP